MKLACCAIIVCITLMLGCARPITSTADADFNVGKLPFGRQPTTTGISPSRTFLPSAARLPQGTAISASPERSLSSASAQAKDVFTAVVDDPIVIGGQTVVPAGTALTGRVLDARPAGHDPGYLRLTLETLNLGGRQIPIATSSLFAKGGSREERTMATIAGGNVVAAAGPRTPAVSEIVLGPGRRLNFRLTQDVDLE